MRGRTAVARMVGRDSVEPMGAYQIFLSPLKKVRTRAAIRCQTRQVKAIRAAARFSYLLFLLRALPESFFLRARPSFSGTNLLRAAQLFRYLRLCNWRAGLRLA